MHTTLFIFNNIFEFIYVFLLLLDILFYLLYHDHFFSNP